jgi:hypothetical protein
MKANIGARTSKAAPLGSHVTMLLVLRMSVSGAGFEGFVQMTGK